MNMSKAHIYEIIGAFTVTAIIAALFTKEEV